ncbi:MAG: outer membrane protein assembly factor BamA [Proteobacteria bacterium]|nr:outer membrane protein assembly factor BamA [Pseudomonadota bacterium]
MKKTSVLFALLSVLFMAAAHAAVINKIDVSGNKRMDTESIKLLTGVKSGDNVDSEKLNGIAKKLQQSGLFATSNATIDGNVLRISVSESPVVDQVTVEGNDAVSTDDLKKEIRLKSRDSYDESVIGADVARMLTVYQRQGYFGTRVEPKKIELSGGRVNVVYEIKEGHPTYIDSIGFVGNDKFSARQLRTAILSTTHAWWKFMANYDTYDEDRIQYDAQMLRQFYMQHGYVDMTVKSTKGTFSADRQYYSVIFTIVEGVRYKFGTLSIENPFPDVNNDDLYDLMKMSTGDTYNIDQVEGTISAIRAAVAANGYAFINVDVVPTKNDDSRTIDLVFKIQKTNRMYFNKVNIIGNVRTFDSVINQQMQIRPGDPFSLQDIDAAKQRMMRTQYFKTIDMVPTKVADGNLMNLDVRVEEQPTGQLQGGIGWSNINGFMIDAGVTETNFMGRGQTLQLRGQIAQYQKQATLSFTEPYLFERQLSAGFDVNYTVYNYSNLGSFAYNRDTFSVSGRLGWRLTDNWTQSVRATAAWDQNYDLHTAGGWARANLYSVGTNFKYYNLDTDFAQQTNTGVTANIGASYTGFGISTETFMKYDGNITGMYKFLDNRWQLKSTLEAGAIQPLEGSYIDRVYRYFLGGDSMRGFDYAGVGSRNWAYRDYSLGGLWKINGTTQLNFPIFIPDQYQVKGFVFVDYGVLGKPPAAENTFFGYPNYVDNNIRMSAGVGVYWNTPMGPMNFSWGWPILKESYDRQQRFLLSIATQF